jgi:nitroreductase/dihydropteridine reductase
MNITDMMITRYTTKSFDPAKPIPEASVKEIENLLRLAPSSTNIQPWKFVIASTAEGKARIAKAASGFYHFNEHKIIEAPLVVVFCTRKTADTEFLEKILAQEKTDGRFNSAEALNGQRSGRSHFVDIHREERTDEFQWLEKQVYLAIGTLLTGAAALKIDACPMEGFDRAILDNELGLHKEGYTSSVIVSLGYHRSDDFNATLPKSRLTAQDIFIRI